MSDISSNISGSIPWDELFDFDGVQASATLQSQSSIFDMSNAGVPHGTIDPSDLFLNPSIPSPAVYSGLDIFQENTETPPAGPTVEELSQQIIFLEHQKETEIGDLKAQHAHEMEALKLENEKLIAALRQSLIAPAPITAPTPVSPPVPIATSAPVTPAAPMTPKTTPTRKRGLIEAMWSPETSPAERAAMVKDLEAPPLHPAPFYEGNQAPQPTTTSSPAAINDLGLSTPHDIIYNGNQAFAPAPGSSPAAVNALTASPSASSLIQAQLSNSPSGGPRKGKSKARAPAKPRTSMTSKRTTTTAAAASKPTSKVTKSTSKRKSASPSPSVRSLQDLYTAQFGTLTHEEKCQLVLPLLQGVDPETGLMTGALPGLLANEADFLSIGKDTFNVAPAQVQDGLTPEPQIQSPYADYAAAQTQMDGGDNSEAHLVASLGNFLYASQLQHDSPFASQEAFGPLLEAARGTKDRTIMQQAAQEFGSGANAGAMRQQEALQRSQPRRR
ncbi:hypothetical protein NX059_002075 [Plenodomus lindquistii]|nr:hypothetical protein NX059_002075 [Plenodomus lindquistii]